MTFLGQAMSLGVSGVLLLLGSLLLVDPAQVVLPALAPDLVPVLMQAEQLAAAFYQLLRKASAPVELPARLH